MSGGDCPTRPHLAPPLFISFKFTMLVMLFWLFRISWPQFGSLTHHGSQIDQKLASQYQKVVTFSTLYKNAAKDLLTPVVWPLGIKFFRKIMQSIEYFKDNSVAGKSFDGDYCLLTLLSTQWLSCNNQHQIPQFHLYACLARKLFMTTRVKIEQMSPSQSPFRNPHAQHH